MARDITELTGRVARLVPLPTDLAVSQETLDDLQDLEESLSRPISDHEARVILRLFDGVDRYDDMAGVLQSILTDLETAPVDRPGDRCAVR